MSEKQDSQYTRSRQRQALITCCLIMMLAIPTILISMPAVFGHDPPWNIPTYAYVAASPNTIGKGQYTALVMWLDKPPPTAGGLGGDLWRGFKLDITKPDGTKQTIGPIEPTSQVASAYVVYTPDQVGNYKIIFSWPGQKLAAGNVVHDRGQMYIGDYFMPATSNPITLTVTANNLQEWQEPPVPDYWTRPVPTANRGWAQLTSNYLKGSWLFDYQRSGTAPNSAHILYAKEILHGGIADEYFGGVKFDTTDYENFFGDPIVMAGKIYLNAGTYPNYGYYCLDLRTGEQEWFKNGTDNGLNNMVTYSSLGSDGPRLGQQFPQLSFGQLLHYRSVNGEGIKDHLWITQSGTPQTNRTGGTMWHLIDPNTGNWVMSLKNVPGGTSVTDEMGNILLYSYSSTTGKFLAWNVTQAIPPPSPTGTAEQQWEPRTGAVIDAVNDRSWTDYGLNFASTSERWTLEDILPRSGYTMNVTGPKGLPGLNSVLQDANRVPKMMFFSDMHNLPLHGSSDMIFDAAAVRIGDHVAPYSPFPSKTETQNDNLGFGVTLLWSKSIQKPLGGNLTFSINTVSYEDRIFTIRCKETRQLWGYNLDTGAQVWGPTEAQNDWNMYGMSGDSAYGKIYSTGYAGIVYCYDIKTGKLLWTYEAPEIGHESPYGNFPLSIAQIADGKIFLYSSEHSPTQPLWRGSYLRAINATDGKEIWKSLNFVSGSAIADGYIVTGNHYDNRMYVYGKGPSATTVTAQPKVVTQGSQILIEGTVTDQSPGAKGTAAIADENMNAWMDYLYMKQEFPSNAKGVQIKLTATDPNGNWQNIGVATTDINGNFGFAWTPPVPGTYKVTATFEGSNSYSKSSTTTYFAVSAAPSAGAIVTPQPSATPVPPTATAPQQTTTPSPSIAPPPMAAEPTTTYLAIGATVIVIVIAAAALVLRRRK